mgnify:CR=1 FL=1
MTNKILYGIYGASGFGREVLPIARAMLENRSDAELFFIDDGRQEETVNGIPVISYEKFFQLDAAEKKISMAIADGKIREKLINKYSADGINSWTLQHQNVVVMDNVEIGEGAILCPFSMVTSNIKIGKCVHLNLYSYVAHDCVIGDFVTFAPSVHCNGNVHIEDHVYVGTGAIIKQGTEQKPLTIGKGAIIGMGAVVTKSVAPGAVVVGNPAKPLRDGIGG